MNSPITLREYVDLIVADLRTHFELRLAELEKRMSGERALLIAANNDRQSEMERRLTALNALRSEVLQDRLLYVTKDAFEIVLNRTSASLPREYYETQHEAVERRIAENAAAIATIRSRNAAYTAAIGLAVMALTAIILIVQFAGGN